MGTPWYKKAISVLRYRPKYRVQILPGLSSARFGLQSVTQNIRRMRLSTPVQFLRPLPRMSVDRGKEFKANEPQFKAKENKIEHTNFSVL
jgi:hypothetical protein